MTALLRSRSLMRGSFHPNSNGTAESQRSNHILVVANSSSDQTWADWESPSRCGGGARTGPPPPRRRRRSGPRLPPIVDDCTALDHSRRVEIAASRGHVYDEVAGVASILAALSPGERSRLADDHMPRRHYRAEKGHLAEAVRKLKATLRWREEFGVEDITRCFEAEETHDDAGGASSLEVQKKRRALAEVIARENETGKIYCRGYDKQGRAILYLTPGKENSTDEYNNMRHLVYHLERAIACTRARSGREKICIVIGYEGFKLTRAPPPSTVRHTLAILQGHYPERMYRAYVCDPPMAFRAFWGVIRHFVDETTLDKVAFCAGREGQRLLERDFDTATTERQAGGTNKGLREYSSREFLFETPFDCTFDEKRE